MTTMEPDTTFASRSVPAHLVRGALGLGFAIAAIALIGPLGPVSLLLLLPAAIAWRGCVSCWALGLAQTRSVEAARKAGRPPTGVRGLAVADEGFEPSKA